MINDINNLTRKELFYLRKERKAYHQRVKEETDAAIEKAAQEKAERENERPPVDHTHRQPQRRKPSNKPTRQRSRHR